MIESLMTMADYAPDRTPEIMELIRHIQHGDKELYTQKAKKRLGEWL